MDKRSFLDIVDRIIALYSDLILNFEAEATTWDVMWKGEDFKNDQFLDYIDLVADSGPFDPAVAEAIKIGLTLPVTTCTIESAFCIL